MKPSDTTVRRECALAALVLAVLTALLIVPSIRGIDGLGNYSFVRSMVMDGDLDFANDFAAADRAHPSQFPQSAREVSPVTGRLANPFGIGAPLFWAPTVLLVHEVLEATAPSLATGFSRPYEWAVALASAGWGCLGVWLLFRRMRGSYGSLVTWTAAAGITLATSLGFYQWAHGSMSHAVSFFLAVMAVLTLERAWSRHTAIDAAMLGLWSGLLTITRYQDATWAASFGLGLVGFWASPATPPPAHGRVQVNRWQAGALFAIGMAISLLPQVIVWKSLYGGYLTGPLPYTDGRMGSFDPWPTHLLGVLVSERGGVFAWHPVLLLGVVGLVWAREGLSPALRTVALLGLALQVWVVASWSWWWGGSSFGNRFFVSAYPCLALGLAECLSALRKRRPGWVGPALVGVLIAWNCGLLVQFGTEMIARDREENGRWTVVIWQQFVDVPRWIVSHL